MGIINFRFRIDWFLLRRRIKFAYQKLTRGFSDGDCWGLYYTMSVWLLPRLKHFRNHHAGYPCNLTSEEWDRIIDKMIYSFQWIVDDNEGDAPMDDIAIARRDEGFDLFGEYWQHLWS